MFSTEWRPRRKFTVNQNVMVANSLRQSYIFITGRIYRIGSLAKQIVTPDGMYEFPLGARKDIYRRIAWKDGRITDSLKMFIEKHPESKYVRGFVRAELNIAPIPSETPTTTEGWLKFIKDNYKEEDVTPIAATTAGYPMDSVFTTIQYTTNTDGTRIPIPAANLPVDGETVPIYCEFEEDVSVSCTYSRRDALTATVPVPLTIVRDGRDAIRDYLYQNIFEYCDRSPGESDDWRDEEIVSSDGVEFEMAQIDEAIRGLDEETRRTIRWFREDRENAA